MSVFPPRKYNYDKVVINFYLRRDVLWSKDWFVVIYNKTTKRKDDGQ
jgi:hypothetical protein